MGNRPGVIALSTLFRGCDVFWTGEGGGGKGEGEGEEVEEGIFPNNPCGGFFPIVFVVILVVPFFSRYYSGE